MALINNQFAVSKSTISYPSTIYTIFSSWYFSRNIGQMFLPHPTSLLFISKSVRSMVIKLHGV